MCIYFNTVALFLVVIRSFLVGWEQDSVENIVLCQPRELFRDLNLALPSMSFGGMQDMYNVFGPSSMFEI